MQRLSTLTIVFWAAASLFVAVTATADDTLDSVSAALEQTFVKWDEIQSKAGSTPETRTYQIAFDRLLAKQQELNKSLNDRLIPFRGQISSDKKLKLEIISELTSSILKAGDWQEGVSIVRESYSDDQEAIQALNVVLGTSSPDDRANDKPVNDPQPAINAAIDHLIVKLAELDEELVKLRWEARGKKPRSKFDQEVIEKLIGLYGYSDVLAAFTTRLNAANSLSDDKSFEILLKLLTILHVYLAPEVGIRTIHLGLHTEDMRTLVEGAFNEKNRNGTLEPVYEQKVRDHKANIAQAIHDKQFLDNLANIAKSKELLMVSFNETRNRHSIMLTAVLFDLFRIQGSSSDLPQITAAFKYLAPVGQLWDFTTCLKAKADKVTNYENRQAICLEPAIYQPEMKELIKLEAKSFKIAGYFDEAQYQWGYAGAAIRLKNNVELPEWMK
ncbi:hypothetical protein M3P05_08630 [Sansalvadorimonas sp. 2012CJ34-2]|uniref:Secreted protein n=1 Tax=Parendozoicomonas callyspongiae TaxID=2942213 RepID=A0ABT0PFK0_9GAMM|nr:hypothetical protein [Sansalvadorimonas sp. 2012CJ34-2]MCL6270001.1 hypothetical protein [Sansalvadorimonas sp. 2012CJ34-2]